MTEEDRIEKIYKEVHNGITIILIVLGLLLILFGMLVIAPTFNWDVKLIAALAVLLGLVLVVWECKKFF